MAFTSGVNAACIVAVALVVIICNVSGQSDFGGVPLNRLKRAAPVSGISDGKEKLEDLNLAEETSEDYPIIFNILLWLGVSLFIATLAICTAIATMDPGRDSLIYRVTSAQRFKKEN